MSCHFYLSFCVECRLGWFGWRISRSNDTTKKICARHHFDTGRPRNGSERIQTNLCYHFEIGFGAMDGWMCFMCCSITLFAWFTMDVGFCIGRNYRSRITSSCCTVPISITYQRLWRRKRHPNIDCKLYLFTFVLHKFSITTTTAARILMLSINCCLIMMDYLSPHHFQFKSIQQQKHIHTTEFQMTIDLKRFYSGLLWLGCHCWNWWCSIRCHIWNLIKFSV